MAESDEQITMTARFYNGETIAMQMVGHGLKPQVLIQMDKPDDDTLHLMVQATGPTDQHDLADFLEMVVEVLREGTPQVSDADPENN